MLVVLTKMVSLNGQKIIRSKINPEFFFFILYRMYRTNSGQRIYFCRERYCRHEHYITAFKIDKAGKIEWKKKYAIVPKHEKKAVGGRAYSVVEKNDGYILVGGLQNNSGIIMKLG